MLSSEENKLLTRTGPGTPGGELLRRYWQPTALSEELPPGGPPLPIQMLGENLVLFRDDQGRIGLLALHCSHRGADLSYGRIEDGGLRCLYHGWLYDIRGRCLEQPGEVEGGKNRGSVRHGAYPCMERAGVIFAYLGPAEPPLFPNYEIFSVPDDHRFAPTKCLHECSYLQANEGNIDPLHLSYLHRSAESAGPKRPVPGSNISHYALLARDLRPRIEAAPTDFGLRIYAIRKAEEERQYVRITNFIMPNLCAIAGQTGQDGYQIDWHVPIDDRSHWKYTIVFRRSAPLTEKPRARRDLTADYRLTRHSENRYLQDREEMKSKTFSGMGTNFLVHDAFAVEGQGAIADRTKEHLSTSDKAIVMARLMLLKAVRDVQQGSDPLHVIRDREKNTFSHLVVRDQVISEGEDWTTLWKP